MKKRQWRKNVKAMFGQQPEKLLPMLRGAEPKSIVPLTRDMFTATITLPKRPS